MDSLGGRGGTDIHLYVERQLEDGSWTPIEPPEEFVLWGEGRENLLKWIKDYGEGENSLIYQWDLDRNYNLFGILANVRNGFGFAGTDTGDGFVPISDPRDLPEDLSPALHDIRVDHSPSWVLWQEVAEYPYWRDGVTNHRGTISAYVYKHWVVEQKRQGPPVNYSGGVAGPGVRYVEPAELDRQLDAIPDLSTEQLRDHFGTYKTIFDCIFTVVQWQGTYREAVGPQWWRFFEVVQGYGIDAKHLRLVFYFDS